MGIFCFERQVCLFGAAPAGEEGDFDQQLPLIPWSMQSRRDALVVGSNGEFLNNHQEMRMRGRRRIGHNYRVGDSSSRKSHRG